MCTMRQHNARKMTLTKTIAAIATSVAVSGSTLIGAPAASAQPAAPAPAAASSTGARDLNSILAWFKSLFSGFSSSNGSSDSSSSLTGLQQFGQRHQRTLVPHLPGILDRLHHRPNLHQHAHGPGRQEHHQR